MCHLDTFIADCIAAGALGVQIVGWDDAGPVLQVIYPGRTELVRLLAEPEGADEPVIVERPR